MKRLIALAAAAVVVGCPAGSVYLPNQPGGPNSDLSGNDVRQKWVEEHPDVDQPMKDAVLEGVFVDGMPYEYVEVITNPSRRATTGNGYWRRFPTGDEIRLRWYLAGTRYPFYDGRKRPVCELTLVADTVTRVTYCEPEVTSPDSTVSVPADTASTEAPAEG